MTEDLIRGLRQLQQRVLQLQESIARAQASAPSQVRARDRTGAVEIALDRDGLPKSVEVADDWQRRIGRAGFGSAVVEASQAAAAERMREPLRAFRNVPRARTPSGPDDGQTSNAPSPTSRRPMWIGCGRRRWHSSVTQIVWPTPEGTGHVTTGQARSPGRDSDAAR